MAPWGAEASHGGRGESPLSKDRDSGRGSSPRASSGGEVGEQASAEIALEGQSGGNAAGRATRELLIRTGERLFALHGINEVSVRGIAEEAGQRNTAAVLYHFGSKDGLIQAITAYRAGPLQRRREARLREIEASGSSHDVAALVRTIVLPYAEEIADPGSYYVRFVANLYRARRDVTEPRGQIGKAARTIRDRLLECLDHLPMEQRRHRIELGWVFMTTALADHEEAVTRDVARLPTELFLVDLTSILTGLLLTSAPVASRDGGVSNPGQTS